jgi:hypothetical protein
MAETVRLFKGLRKSVEQSLASLSPGTLESFPQAELEKNIIVKREFMMYRTWTAILLTLMLTLTFSVAPSQSQSPGQLRALKERAIKITKMKNDFVLRVLKSYDLDYRLTKEGIVAQLNLDGKWIAVNQIDIIPIAVEDPTSLRVKGHQIFFYTDTQILNLVSDAVVR